MAAMSRSTSGASTSGCASTITSSGSFPYNSMEEEKQHLIASFRHLSKTLDALSSFSMNYATQLSHIHSRDFTYPNALFHPPSLSPGNALTGLLFRTPYNETFQTSQPLPMQTRASSSSSSADITADATANHNVATTATSSTANRTLASKAAKAVAPSTSYQALRAEIAKRSLARQAAASLVADTTGSTLPVADLVNTNIADGLAAETSSGSREVAAFEPMHVGLGSRRMITIPASALTAFPEHTETQAAIPAGNGDIEMASTVEKDAKQEKAARKAEKKARKEAREARRQEKSRLKQQAERQREESQMAVDGMNGAIDIVNELPGAVMETKKRKRKHPDRVGQVSEVVDAEEAAGENADLFKVKERRKERKKERSINDSTISQPGILSGLENNVQLQENGINGPYLRKEQHSINESIIKRKKNKKGKRLQEHVQDKANSADHIALLQNGALPNVAPLADTSMEIDGVAAQSESKSKPKKTKKAKLYNLDTPDASLSSTADVISSKKTSKKDKDTSLRREALKKSMIDSGTSINPDNSDLEVARMLLTSSKSKAVSSKSASSSSFNFLQELSKIGMM